ncbi:hypothetical protein HMPREF9412_3369 [Paenibacillus sp. HGF5]|nr:hypothetical protein HMPREF9412_3369 [Paenibacillus sp. HGF5]
MHEIRTDQADALDPSFYRGGFLCHGEAPMLRVEPASHYMLTVFRASR